MNTKFCTHNTPTRLSRQHAGCAALPCRCARAAVRCAVPTATRHGRPRPRGAPCETHPHDFRDKGPLQLWEVLSRLSFDGVLGSWDARHRRRPSLRDVALCARRMLRRIRRWIAACHSARQISASAHFASGMDRGRDAARCQQADAAGQRAASSSTSFRWQFQLWHQSSACFASTEQCQRMRDGIAAARGPLCQQPAVGIARSMTLEHLIRPSAVRIPTQRQPPRRGPWPCPCAARPGVKVFGVGGENKARPCWGNRSRRSFPTPTCP